MTSRITSRFVLSGAAGLVALALVASSATVAHADAFRHTDATGDVVVTHTGSPGTSEVKPNLALPDFENLTVLHSRWTLSVATALRELEGGFTTWTSTIVTSKGDRFDVIRLGIAEYPKVIASYRIVRNGYRFTCNGLYVGRTPSGIIAKVPTRCLGNPWKVRVGVLAHADYGDGAEPHSTGHDDVLRNGIFTYRNPALSSWIAR